MINTLRAEVLKIRTTKLWWIIAICVLVLGAGNAVIVPILAMATSSMDPAATANPFVDQGTLLSTYNGGNSLSRILAMVVGIMAMGTEYRHKTMAITYLAAPQRLRVISAKAIALLIFGLGYGVINLIAGIAVAVPFVITQDGRFFFDQVSTWRSLGLGVLSLGLWAMIGMGFGILIKNMILATLLGIGFAYMIEPAISVLFLFKEWYVPLNLMPTGATNAMLGVNSQAMLASPDPFVWWQGALVLAGWCLLPALIGAIFTVRRDVD